MAETEVVVQEEVTYVVDEATDSEILIVDEISLEVLTEGIQGPPGVGATNLFLDSEGDPMDVSGAAAADGSSAYASRRDHRHHGVKRVVALADAATIATNTDSGEIFTVTLGGNRTLGNPTGTPVNGQQIIYRFRQDGVGNRTITLDSAFKLGTGLSAITLSTAANKTDWMGAVYNSADSNWQIIAFANGY